MSPIMVPNRPFSTDLITGLMLPDGIFEITLGNQLVNAHFTNSGAVDITNNNVYVESVSHPGIIINPQTHYINNLKSGASRVLSWNADFSNADPGIHLISFIVSNSSGFTRIIKKIFVTQVNFNETTSTFSAKTPEGILEVRFRDLVIPADIMCCKKWMRKGKKNDRELSILLNQFGKLFTRHDNDFIFCPPGYLPLELEAVVKSIPPYFGQYGDLPFQDPWWKVLLCIIAVILLIAAAIVAASEGDEITVTTNGGGTGDPSRPDSCCGVEAEGGSSSYVVAGLVAAAAAAATAACASDERDPFQRGRDNTTPEGSEMTIEEKIDMAFIYPEPVSLGKPFAAGLEWKYTRITSGNNYTYSATDSNTNSHVLSNYIIKAPEIIHQYQKEPFLIMAEFFDKNGNSLKGDQLLVQCFLIGPNDEYRKIIMQDDGISPDEKPSDGVYTGRYHFEAERRPKGIWTYYVIAQDINNANPEMKPEEAAKIIGGMVMTHQLVITFDEDECPFVPDGHVRVL